MFELFIICFFIYHIFLYALFRGGIYDYLRLSKVSKTYIRKNRKGIKNYWLYSQIHKEHSLGALYYINIGYLFSILILLVAVVLLGQVKEARNILFLLAAVVCLFEVPCTIFESIMGNRVEFGKSFVLFAIRKETKKIYSSLIDYLAAFVPVVLLYLSYINLK